MLAFYIIGSIAFYIFGMGVSHRVFYDWTRDFYDSDILIFLCTTFWPVAFLCGGGVKAANLRNRPSKTERRREFELAEAKHQADIAKIKRIEAEELDRELALAKNL